MRKLLFFVLVSLLFNFIYAHGGNFTETKELIDSGISCEQLTEEQLEEIGDYYMEQMHPGEQHEWMDQMMGGENSQSLRDIHITMAKTIYCNENTGYSGMMGIMGGYSGSSMTGAMWLPWILFWTGALLLIFAFLHKNSSKHSALDTLKKRYAKGEITKKEFDKMKKDVK